MSYLRLCGNVFLTLCQAIWSLIKILKIFKAHDLKGVDWVKALKAL